MMMHLVSPAKFSSALLVGADKSLLKVDKDALARVGVRSTRMAASSRQAMAALAKFTAQIVVVGGDMTDMSALDFVRALKNSETHRDLPVIMIARASGRGAVLTAVAAGCLGYLVRPYSHLTLSRYLDTAWRLREVAGERDEILRRAGLDEIAGETAMAIGDTPALAAGEDPVRYFRAGVRHFKAGRLDEAVEFFAKAASINDLYAEAHLGLTRAYAAKGLESPARKHFAKAARAALMLRCYDDLRGYFEDMHRRDAGGFNPFAALGREMATRRDLARAEEAFAIALELAPNDASLHLDMARVHHAARRPEKALEAVNAALEISEDDQTAQALYRRLTGRGHDDLVLEWDERDGSGGSVTMRIVNAVLFMAAGASEAIHKLRRGEESQAA